MPPMVFPARCGTCGTARKFIEFKVVPCGPHAEAEKREYGFRCLRCRATVPEVRDEEGHLHRWVRGEHVAEASA